MLRLLTFLIVTAALAFVATWLADNPGTVTVDIAGYVLTTRVGVMLAVVAGLGFLVALVLEAWRWLKRTPRRMAERRERNRERRGYQELSMGLIAAAAGDVAGARTHSQKAQRLLGTDPASLLLSAQTAQLEGRDDLAKQRFEAMLGNRETELLALRGLLSQAIKSGDREEALNLARRAQSRNPNAHWAVSSLFDLQTRSGLWHEALRTLDELIRLRLLDPATASRRRGVLYHMIAVGYRDRNEPREALKYARRAQELVPGFAPAGVLLAETARSQGRSAEARKGLERTWGTTPHPAVARAYAMLVEHETAAEKLKRCQRLAELQPNRFETHMALGELALSARQWSDARNHLERALSLSPTSRAFRLMADVARQSGGSSEQIQEWLQKAVDAPPDDAWVCEQTGSSAGEWSPFGPGGQFDTLRWTTPPKIQALRGDEPGAMVISHESGIADLPVPVDAVLARR